MGENADFKTASLATTYEIDDSFDSTKFIRMRLRIAHDGINPNKSSFVVEGLENAEKSIYNSPILANVTFDDEGNPQFGGHDMEYEPDKTKDGEYKLIYKETPIGVIPESCNYKIEDYNGKKYAFADCYIYKGYSNYAQNIIERDKEIKLSMEIIVDNYSYDGKEKVFNITDFRYQGITFLNKDYGTGMENARGTTETFSTDEHKEKFILLMSEVKDAIAEWETKQNNKGADDLENELKYVKSFELSHEDIRYSLYQLLRVAEENDNEWYFVDRVFDDNFEYQGYFNSKIYRQSYVKDGDNVSFTGDRIELFQERLTAEEKASLDSLRANYESIKTEFDSYKELYKTEEPVVESLRKYQVDKMAEERVVAENAIYAKFDETLKDNKEYENLKAHSGEYDLETLSEKCFSILGKFAANNPQTTFQKNNKISVDRTLPESDPYGGLYEIYGKKK